MTHRWFLAAAVMTVLAAAQARAQDWPAKHPIKVVVPFTAGSSTDNFNDISERLIVAPYYPPPNSAPTSGVPAAIELDRNADGTFTALPSGNPNTGTTLTSAPAVKVQLTVSWASTRGKVRQRETTTFLSRNGL